MEYQRRYLTVIQSQIQRVHGTEATLDYVGSVTIDEDLLDASGILVGEKVQIVNNNNGERIETYTIPGERGSGIICLNGAAARKFMVGDIVIIVAYAMVTPEEARTLKPNIIFPDTATNKLAQ
ncbi:MAG: aspartate 1-decarboxylase [Porphyromonas sp.]|nr:aspartate 1-decarboxylase [Porphyromonas sp.]